MMVTDLFLKGSYIDVALLLLIVLTILAAIIGQRKTKQRVEERIELLFDNANKLKVNHRELSKKINAFFESTEAALSEIDNKMESLEAGLSDTQDSLSKTIEANRKETQRMEKKLSDFSKDIQKMKEYIREWAIDMEL